MEATLVSKEFRNILNGYDPLINDDGEVTERVTLTRMNTKDYQIT